MYYSIKGSRDHEDTWGTVGHKSIVDVAHWFREHCLCKSNIRRLWEASQAQGRTQWKESNVQFDNILD